jgi:hypothetical protein
MAFLEAIETEEQIKYAVQVLSPMPVSFSITFKTMIHLTA